MAAYKPVDFWVPAKVIKWDPVGHSVEALAQLTVPDVAAKPTKQES